MAANVQARWVFPRLWFLLFFSYVGLKFAFNLAVMGYIDLRPAAFSELLLVPLGQSLILWMVGRRGREHRAAHPPDDLA